MAEVQKTEYKIRLEFIFKNISRFKKTRHLIQNKPFKFGIRIKNIDEKSIPRGFLENLKLTSGEGANIKLSAHEKMSFNSLNPGEETEVWWPEPFTPILNGKVWVNCSIEPEDPIKSKFLTYQYDKVCKTLSKRPKENTWQDAIIVRGELENHQAQTNTLILILTLITFLQGAWGINTIFKKISSIIGLMLKILSNIFTTIGQ